MRQEQNLIVVSIQMSTSIFNYRQLPSIINSSNVLKVKSRILLSKNVYVIYNEFVQYVE